MGWAGGRSTRHRPTTALPSSTRRYRPRTPSISGTSFYDIYFFIFQKGPKLSVKLLFIYLAKLFSIPNIIYLTLHDFISQLYIYKMFYILYLYLYKKDFFGSAFKNKMLAFGKAPTQK